jgi:hypothetical protein
LTGEGDSQLPRDVVGRFVVALEDIGEDRLARRLDRANAGEIRLTGEDHAAILRVLAGQSTLELAELSRVLEEQHPRTSQSLGREDRIKLREARMAANEAFFRSINERLETQTPDSPMLIVLCECADEDCAQRLQVTRREYEEIRSDSAQFVVAHGHAEPEIEDVLAHTDRFELVRKVGLGVDIARRLDE